MITHDTKIIISYRSGNVEVCYAWRYKVTDGCLSTQDGNGETRYIPLDLIKEWRVYDRIGKERSVNGN